ncbi:MAG: glycogen synthase GlgA [Defluviitaleaceae bacterium]|nr:glycogen synthase GlgA [Defluviitaleaceae bacterium]
MKVLFAVSECAPFVKSGGLADVAGALPKALQQIGVDVRVILPLYGQIPETFKLRMRLKKVLTVRMGWREAHCGLFELRYEGVHYYFIDHEYYFKRTSLYGHGDDGERFSYFCRAVLDVIPYLNFVPDVIHSHDWHTGMIGFLLKERYRTLPLYRSIKNVFTIHNLQFQGIFPRSVMHDLLMLDDPYFHVDQLEFYGQISFMKGALIAADKITTVSETYQHEIQQPFFGYQLDGLLRALNYKLVGVLNGIDTTIYSPEVDQHIAVNYQLKTLDQKKKNKRALQKALALEVSDKTPIVAMVTRLSKQKGIDLVQHVFHEMMHEDVQFILIGNGEGEYESFFAHMEHLYRDKVRSFIGFDEAFAHQVYAGADLFLMPSLFEPCGLSQLIAMAYGTLPLVRETGGLNDTVMAYDEQTGAGTGFSFANYNAHEFLFTYEKALELYRKDSQVWKQLMINAMSADYSWHQSALTYKAIYDELFQNERSARG